MIAQQEAGLASGLLNTSQQLGGVIVLPATAALARRKTSGVPGAAFVAGDGLRPFAGSPPPAAALGLVGHHQRQMAAFVPAARVEA